MGAGASALGVDDPTRHAANPSGNINLTRLRKSLLIRAYNVRNQGMCIHFITRTLVSLLFYYDKLTIY